MGWAVWSREELARRRVERRAGRVWWLQPWELELYGLYDLPADALKSFLSDRAWNKVVRPALNDQAWCVVVDNKWVAANYWASLGVAIPETYGLLHPTSGAAMTGEPLRSLIDLAEWSRAVTTSFVLKPLGGWQGEGVVVVRDVVWTSGAPHFVTAEDRTLSINEFERSLVMDFRGIKGYLVQETLQQHLWLQGISGGASNSLRVVTFLPDNGEPFVQMAVLRLGRVGHMVDNWAVGGVAVHIDVGSGRLGRGRLKPKYGGCWVTSHPDTGRQFVDQVIPEWPAVCDKVLHAARVTPGLRSVGWDVILSDRGPSIIEGNASWDLQLMQIHTGGLLTEEVGRVWAEHGIDLPDGSGRWRRQYGPGIRRKIRRRVRKTVRKVAGVVT
jgi:hypothetical protein